MTSTISNGDALHGPVNAIAPRTGQRRSSTLWQKVRNCRDSVRQVASTPLLMMGFNINPLSSSPEGAANVLRRIDDVASRGLQRAGIRGVKYERVTGPFHEEIDHLLMEDKRGDRRTQTTSISGMGQAISTPPLPLDSEVTRAIPLQVRIEETDWMKKRDEHQEALASKLSAFSAVLLMREACGITEKDNATLLKIVEQGTRPGETATLWDLFTHYYNTLSWFQKCKAGWFYWTCYQTSLITNTVKAYLHSFVDGMTKDLTAESDRTRLQFIRDLLDNANEFLIEDIGATRAFASAVEPDGDLEKYRRRAIERHYGNSLENLCKAFSKKVVNEDYKVHFFQKFKAIPILGWLIEIFEWLVNRLVIQNVMKFSILPSLLQSSVENGIEATEPHNLPFALELTRFLNTQIEKLRASVDTLSRETSPPLPGTEKIPETIKHLKKVLDLEPHKTQDALREKLEELKNEKGLLDRKIEEVIQRGIIEACHTLFALLNSTAKSGELFADLLELSCAAFSEQAEHPTVLMAAFKEEQSKLQRNSRALFQQIIHSTIETTIKAVKPEDAKSAAKSAFLQGKQIAHLTLTKLEELRTQITEKIDRQNDVQADLAALFQYLQVFANRKELQDAINPLPRDDQDAIWRRVTPFYEKMHTLGTKILHLQERQDSHLAHTSVTTHLTLIYTLLGSIRTQFYAQPRYFHNPLILTLENTIEKIGAWLGSQGSLTLRLSNLIKTVSALSEQIAREQQVIDAIHALSPPRREGQQIEREGPIDQLINYERGIDVRGFQPKACLKEIGRHLECFPADEQQNLRGLIGNGSNLIRNRAALSVLLQEIYEKHTKSKDDAAEKFDAALKETESWARDKVSKYKQLSHQDHLGMQTEMTEIAKSVQQLSDEVLQEEPLDLPFYFSSGQTKVALATAGAGIGWVLASLGGWLAGPIGAAVGAGAATFVYSGTQNLSGLDHKQPGAIGKAALSFVAGTAAASLIPGGPALIGAGGGFFTALNGEQALHTNSQQRVLPPVMEIFENAYQLLLSPRVYLAATTRLMKTV